MSKYSQDDLPDPRNGGYWMHDRFRLGAYRITSFRGARLGPVGLPGYVKGKSNYVVYNEDTGDFEVCHLLRDAKAHARAGKTGSHNFRELEGKA